MERLATEASIFIFKRVYTHMRASVLLFEHHNFQPKTLVPREINLRVLQSFTEKCRMVFAINCEMTGKGMAAWHSSLITTMPLLLPTTHT